MSEPPELTPEPAPDPSRDDPADDPQDARVPEESGSDGCIATSKLLAQFVERGLRRDEDRFFRRHLTHCANCRESYRETLASAAKLGRSLRARRAEAERIARREVQARMARAAGEGRRPSRRFGLRLAVFSALGVLLFTQLDLGGEAPSFQAGWEGGDVRAAGTTLGPDLPEIGLERGDWCVTAPDGRARVSAGGDSIDVDHATHLLIEDPEAQRVRLQVGAVTLRGDWALTSQVGVVTLGAGEARVEIHEGALELECVAGKARFVDGRGAIEVFPGERRRFAHLRVANVGK